jgi:peptidoglycan/LPS O-acetylase OafA/YrhL
MNVGHVRLSQGTTTLTMTQEAYSVLDEKRALENASQTIECPPSPRTYLREAFSNPQGALIPPGIRLLAYRLCFILLPSFVQRRITGETSKPEKLYPTSHLDGIRGLAAFFVFFCHLSYSCFIITYGFGLGEDGDNYHLLQLPIIRLFYSGPPMVSIFFIVSGYALSLKPLKQMRGQQWDSLLNTLSSSIFRRGFRLFLPTTISTFMIVLALRAGWYESTRAFADNPDMLRNIREYHPFRHYTFHDQFWDWVWTQHNFLSVWSWDVYAGSTRYDVHLWTIPTEFRSSLFLFLCLAGTARCRSYIRLATLAGIAYFVLRSDRWELMLFLSGAILAELDLARSARMLAHGEKHIRMTPLRKAWWMTVGIVALYLMSQPDEFGDETPGWIYLSSLIPPWFSTPYRWWQSLGAVLFVWAVNNAPFMQKPFNTPSVQYLGKISYALYLMHGPVIHTIGYQIEPWAWSITGSDTEVQYKAGFLLAAAFIIPCLIWMADVFWRMVDIPCVKIARWIETKCIVED